MILSCSKDRLWTVLSGAILVIKIFSAYEAAAASALQVSEVGVAQNLRGKSQDRIRSRYLPETGRWIFAVLDGHGSGKSAFASDYAATHLIQRIETRWGAGASPDELFTLSFLEVDQELCQLTPDGTTTTVALFDPLHSELQVAHVGDSPALYHTGWRSLLLTNPLDHPEGSERLRLLRSGGRVFGNRVEGKLSVSRALGDIHWKWGRGGGMSNLEGMGAPTRASNLNFDHYLISPLPHVSHVNVKKKWGLPFPFLILASDGLFDGPGAWTFEGLSRFVKNQFKKGRTAQEVASRVLEGPQGGEGTSEGDDLSIIVVRWEKKNALQDWKEKVSEAPVRRVEPPVNFLIEDLMKNPTYPKH
jgi:serine/threonine protein phosphatase PrpC